MASPEASPDRPRFLPVTIAILALGALVIVPLIVWDWFLRPEEIGPVRAAPPAPLVVRSCDGAFSYERYTQASAWWKDRCTPMGQWVEGSCTRAGAPAGEAWVHLATQGHPNLHDWGVQHLENGVMVSGDFFVHSYGDELGDVHLGGHILGYADYDSPGHIMASRVRRGQRDDGVDLCEAD